ncbi:hypothetical protein ILYODFUR_022020 [Ilyodon furcidens]|uniref:Uncharacterized protein n=1 Tax=Ilyodon furcidens TaxID=33524 RepID=A0ABV0SZ25_9TELE
MRGNQSNLIKVCKLHTERPQLKKRNQTQDLLYVNNRATTALPSSIQQKHLVLISSFLLFNVDSLCVSLFLSQVMAARKLLKTGRFIHTPPPIWKCFIVKNKNLS